MECQATLLGLPVELRGRILELVFPAQVVLTSLSSENRRYPRHQVLVNPSNHLAITEANRQLHHEATKIFWLTTTFTFFHPEEREASAVDEDIYQWLNTAAVKNNVQCIRHLRFVCRRLCHGCGGSIGRCGHDWWLTIAVNLNKSNPKNAISFSGELGESSLSHAYDSRVLVGQAFFDPDFTTRPLYDVLSSINRDNDSGGMPEITIATVWSIWESLYTLEDDRSKNTRPERRSWEHFSAVYEFNQKKENPQPWNESTYFRTSREMMTGIPWDEYIRVVMKEEKHKRLNAGRSNEKCVVS